MLKHIVMWKLRAEAEGASKNENAIKIKKRLERLQSIIPGAYRLEVGIGCNPAGYDLVLYSEFDDQDSFENYRVHPEQARVNEFIGRVASDQVTADYMDLLA